MAADRFELVIGLHVTDEETYRRYRAGMMPILAAYGGTFRYDFRIGETLKSETAETINRLFVLTFPDQTTSGRFFSDDDYRKVRKVYFDASVAAVTEIATVNPDS